MASYNEVMDVNAKSMPKRKGAEAKPELKEMTHSRSANGGHVFEHRMHQSAGPYHEPEMHTFGAEEGKKALAHFAQHAGLSEHMGGKKEEPEDGEAAGAAY